MTGPQRKIGQWRCPCGHYLEAGSSPDSPPFRCEVEGCSCAQCVNPGDGGVAKSMEKKKIVLVGAGALGSHLALLVRNHVDIKVVDFDRVEAKNAMSQLHPLGSVGKNKALALQQTLKFLFGLRVEAVPHKLVVDNAREILENSDLVVDCVDNGGTRRLIQGFCKMEKIPCLHGALAAGGQFGQVTWTDKFQADDGSEGAPTCEDGEHLPFISTVSSLLAQCVQAFVRRGEQRSFLVFPGGTKEV